MLREEEAEKGAGGGRHAILDVVRWGSQSLGWTSSGKTRAGIGRGGAAGNAAVGQGAGLPLKLGDLLRCSGRRSLASAAMVEAGGM